MNNNLPTLSIVATLYHSAQYIDTFYQRCLAMTERLAIDNIEFVLVDDGSPDNSLDVAVGLARRDSRVKVVELSRNFGHNKAIMTGLEASSGEYVFLIDIDLEEPPELLEQFWHRMHDQNKSEVDMLYGVQQQRKGDKIEQYTGGWYYKMFNLLADDIHIEPNISTVRLMKNQFVSQLLKYKEHEFYFGAVCAMAGFKQQPIYFVKQSHSQTTYHFLHKYNLFVNSIFAFSKKPLYFIFYFGLLLTLVAFSYGGYLFVRKLVFEAVLDGWTSIMVSIWFLGGVIILFLGIIAIYLSKVFSQTKHHPFAVVKMIHQHAQSEVGQKDKS